MTKREQRRQIRAGFDPGLVLGGRHLRFRLHVVLCVRHGQV
jgi:hypothetical protein